MGLQIEHLKTKTGSYTTYAKYYPIGMGIMDMAKAIEDIKWILAQHCSQ